MGLKKLPYASPFYLVKRGWIPPVQDFFSDFQHKKVTVLKPLELWCWIVLSAVCIKGNPFNYSVVNASIWIFFYLWQFNLTAKRMNVLLCYNCKKKHWILTYSRSLVTHYLHSLYPRKVVNVLLELGNNGSLQFLRLKYLQCT